MISEMTTKIWDLSPQKYFINYQIVRNYNKATKGKVMRHMRRRGRIVGEEVEFRYTARKIPHRSPYSLTTERRASAHAAMSKWLRCVSSARSKNTSSPIPSQTYYDAKSTTVLILPNHLTKSLDARCDAEVTKKTFPQIRGGVCNTQSRW